MCEITFFPQILISLYIRFHQSRQRIFQTRILLSTQVDCKHSWIIDGSIHGPLVVLHSVPNIGVLKMLTDLLNLLFTCLFILCPPYKTMSSYKSYHSAVYPSSGLEMDCSSTPKLKRVDGKVRIES